MAEKLQPLGDQLAVKPIEGRGQQGGIILTDTAPSIQIREEEKNG